MFKQENEFHQQAIILLGENKIDESRDLFKYSAEEFSYAPSYFELAKIEYKDNTIQSRTRARKLLQKAIWKDPDNIEYRLLMAELMEYFSRGMAFDVYEEIIEIDPNCGEALFNLGRISEEEFYEFYRSVRKEEFSPARSMDGFAIEDFKLAEKYFLRTISLSPRRIDSYLHLCHLYQEAGMLYHGINLLNDILQFEPANTEMLLFLGYLYYKTANFDSSGLAYSKALELMNEQEREEFKTKTALLFLDEKETVESKKDSILYSFWKKRDPLYLTEYNERILEHYSRVVYSNLKFSVEKKNVRGWDSDRGEILIRYGEPVDRVRFRPFINAGGRTALMLKTDVWVYGDKTFGFTDDYWTGDYRFSAPNYSGRHFSQFNYDTHTYIEYLRRTEPEDFKPVFKGPSITLPFNTLQFKNLENENNKLTQVFLNYAVDITGRFEFRDRYKLDHRCGLFFLDEDANIISESRSSYNYLHKNNRLDLEETGKYWINSLTLNAKPDTGVIAFELIRKRDEAVSTNHFDFRIKEFNNENLDLSDIVLAANISKDDEKFGSIVRKNIQILPNPTNTFTINNNIFLYYEVYNLKQDAANKCSFEQKIKISKIQDKTTLGNILSAISELFSSSESSEELTLTTNYESFERNTQVYLQIDMSNYSKGSYRVEVSVFDELSGEEASAQTIIDWRN